MLKRYVVAFRKEYSWRTNRVDYYVKRISAHVKKYPDLAIIESECSKLSLDPLAYRFNKEKADAALNEVNQWIQEENLKKGKHT